ncbi:MAG TPA: hypothetical protein PK574_05315 [Fervidobacterium sp.]|nr:hypothetical protein [Fervidobacterium sp.]HPT54323.1 hypothetical protein [Fervidobacterium sp.]
MPSNNFQSIPINKKPDVILSIFEKDNRFISTKRRSRAEGKKKRTELDDPFVNRDMRNTSRQSISDGTERQVTFEIEINSKEDKVRMNVRRK